MSTAAAFYCAVIWVPQMRTWRARPQNQWKGAATSGYWPFKAHDLSVGLWRFALSWEWDTRSRHCFGGSSLFCRLKIFQTFFILVPPSCWVDALVAPKAMSDCGVSSKADAYMGFLQHKPSWSSRMEAAIWAKIYSHGVSCEPKYDLLQWCMFSSQQGALVVHNTWNSGALTALMSLPARGIA